MVVLEKESMQFSLGDKFHLILPHNTNLDILVIKKEKERDNNRYWVELNGVIQGRKAMQLYFLILQVKTQWLSVYESIQEGSLTNSFIFYSKYTEQTGEFWPNNPLLGLAIS